MSDKLSSQSKISSSQELKEGKIGRYTIKIKSDTIPRVSILSTTSIEKIRSILAPKKNTATVSTTGTFTATLTGGSTTDYYCEAAVEFGGPIDWYLIEESTSTYTYIATTASESIFFFISNPTPGYYRVWGQSATNGIDTNPVYLGTNPYPGVTLNNGILEFTDLAAYENLIIQLENEVEQHNADFFDSRNYMTDDAINDLADSIGFDEFKPLRDFENYFGFSSLRIQVENQINAWLSYPHSTLSGYPEDNYKIDNEVEQTLLNTSGQVIIAGTQITKDVIMGSPSDPGESGCIWEDRKIVNEDYASNRVLKKKIIIDGESCNPSVYCSPKAMFKGKGLTFRKKGLFRKFATKMRVRLYGKAYNNLCNFLQDYDTGFNNSNLKRRYRMVVKNSYPNTNNIATKYYQTTTEIQLNGSTYSLIYAP